MLELNGKYNKAKVFTNNIESMAISQIIDLCNQRFAKDSKIRIMPDVHAGAGCTIGTTMTITDKVVPYLVGVDIGCGMLCVKIADKEIDFEKLDKLIRQNIPHGFSIHKKSRVDEAVLHLQDLNCYTNINSDRALKSVGTLGGGNHFIEIDKDEEGNFYLVIHTGSRNLGKQIAEHYQKLAAKKLNDNRKIKEELINKLKIEGKEKEIQKELKELQIKKVPEHFAYVEGQDLEDYLKDIEIAQSYATINRIEIASIIINGMGWKTCGSFTTIHNYIDTKERILRKGAISANLGERVLIPMNMKDGSIIAVGRGNEDWNCSAPHGAGRIMSRRQAKEKVDLEEFKISMKDIYSTSVNKNTIDEAPMVYKPMEEIIKNINETVVIEKIIKPVYNFKSN